MRAGSAGFTSDCEPRPEATLHAACGGGELKFLKVYLLRIASI